MLAGARGELRHLALAVVDRIDDDVAIGGGQGDEVPLRVDHHLLDVARAAFEQAAQQVRLARARIALNQQAGGEKFFEINRNRLAGRIGSHVDGNGHAGAFGRWQGAAARGMRRFSQTALFLSAPSFSVRLE
ncbi:hypothetical protein GCM10009095_29520 [Sphingomonas molluscorum]|nr:hypothetical protein GCM10017606_20540 [Microbacterium terregens]